METRIIAERNSPSDESLILLESFFADGDFVQKGQVLFEMEGAKALFEIEAPIAGFIFINPNTHEVVQIGEILAIISSEKLTSSPEFSNVIQPDFLTGALEAGRVSKKALNLAKSLNFNLDQLSDLEFISEKDVLAAINAKEDNHVPFKPLSSFQRIVFLGGGHGSELAYHCLNAVNQQVVGVFDDSQNLLEPEGIQTLGRIDEKAIVEYWENGFFTHAMLTITSNLEFREKVISILEKHKIPCAVIIHESVKIPESCSIGEGTLIMDGARLGIFSKIGRHVFLSAFVNVEHHCFVANNVTFGPGVFLSGEVQIGDNVAFGSNIGVEPGIKIGAKTRIASGLTITSNIPENSLVKNVGTLKIRSTKLRE